MNANPARIAESVAGQLAMIPGWVTEHRCTREDTCECPPGFADQCGTLAHLSATPGWQDTNALNVVPNAKPIGLAQWGAALVTAGLVTANTPGAELPEPGIDPAGFIWLTWQVADNARLELELHANLLHQTYAWTSVRDGMPRRFESSEIGEVIAALKAVLVGARKAA